MWKLGTKRLKEVYSFLIYPMDVEEKAPEEGYCVQMTIVSKDTGVDPIFVDGRREFHNNATIFVWTASFTSLSPFQSEDAIYRIVLGSEGPAAQRVCRVGLQESGRRDVDAKRLDKVVAAVLHTVPTSDSHVIMLVLHQQVHKIGWSQDDVQVFASVVATKVVHDEGRGAGPHEPVHASSSVRIAARQWHLEHVKDQTDRLV